MTNNNSVIKLTRREIQLGIKPDCYHYVVYINKGRTGSLSGTIINFDNLENALQFAKENLLKDPTNSVTVKKVGYLFLEK